MDYSGKLFIGIFKQYPLIWNKYIDWVIKHLDKKSNKIIDSIWIDEDWENCINYAYKTVIEDRECFFIEEPAKFLFLSSENELIVERKKKWLQNYLQKNYMDMNRINKLFSIISTVLSEWKVEFIFQFLKLNKSFEDFKQLSFFPLPQFVVGSEIPRILEKISFLKMLLNNLKGIEYIEHINYLEEMLRELEKFKKETEMKEYLESSDFI